VQCGRNRTVLIERSLRFATAPRTALAVRAETEERTTCDECEDTCNGAGRHERGATFRESALLCIGHVLFPNHDSFVAPLIRLAVDVRHRAHAKHVRGIISLVDDALDLLGARPQRRSE